MVAVSLAQVLRQINASEWVSCNTQLLLQSSLQSALCRWVRRCESWIRAAHQCLKRQGCCMPLRQAQTFNGVVGHDWRWPPV